MDSNLSSAPFSQSNTGKATIAAVNATALYILAYLLVHGLFQLATVAMASRLGIGGIWHLSSLQFNIADSTWWELAVVAVYGVGPAVSLALGIGAVIWFRKSARLQRGLLKLFLFWVMLHGCNLALGALAADTITQSGVWYVPSWLFRAGNGVNVMLALTAALLQTGLGYPAAKAFLQSHDSITLMLFSNRRLLLISTLLAPWLLGSLLLAALQWPDQTLNERLRVLTMLLLIGPLYLAAINEISEDTIESPSKTRLALGILLLLALVMLGWRLALNEGVQFG